MAKKISGGTRTYKGFYEIKNPEKYMGDPYDCRYLSNWEKRFMIYLDFNEKIIKWGSELDNHIIPYMGPDGRMHRYYPDFYAQISAPDHDKLMIETIIEIKPYAEIKPKWVINENNKLKVKPPKNFKSLKAYESFEYQLKTFQKNLAKWEAAKKWCDDRYLKFWLISEKELKKMGIL
jgi:Straboviridae/Kyanoviridae head completion nuclease